MKTFIGVLLGFTSLVSVCLGIYVLILGWSLLWPYYLASWGLALVNAFLLTVVRAVD